MVLESLINPVYANKKPWDMFIIGMIYSSIAVMLGMFVFREYASLVMIFLTVLASVPLMYGAVKMEEKKDLEIVGRKSLFKEHAKTLSFFMFLFMGFVFSFSLWYVFLPAVTTQDIFHVQIKEIQRVQNIDVTGDVTSLTAVFGQIFLNNIMVMLFALLFAFFYGVGAIFILTWNASILGAAIGNFINNSLGMGYFSAYPLAFLRYSIHGIPEMFAYFMAGLAGSIISIAIIRHDFGSGKFHKVLTDSLDMIFLSVFVLFVAAALEVFVTPLFF